MRTPQEVACAAYPEDTATSFAMRAILVEVITQDRQEREGEYSVIAIVNKSEPEARVGVYRTEFEANAVAKEWNRVNNKHGVKYHVEKDW